MTRKTTVIIIGIVLVIIVSFLSWYFFFSKPATPAISTTGTGLPFGQGGENVVPSNNEQGSNINGVSSDSTKQPTTKLFRLSDQPVAGMIAFNKKTGETVVRYVDRATGHIYDINPTTLEKTEISNTTFPKIQEVYFKNDGSSVLLRDLKGDSDAVENISLSLTAPKATTTNSLYTIKATNLVGDIKDVSVGPTNLLVYILGNSGSIVSSAFDGSKGVNILPSGFTNWRISWPSTNLITLVTKASSGVSGFAYNLNVSTGGLTKILGPLNALTLIESSDGKRVAYSYNSNGKTTFEFKNLTDGLSDQILPTTFADKCIWSKKSVGVLYCGTPSATIGSGEPDNWYQGITHFSDQIWRFSTVTYTSELLFEPKKDSGTDIDLINPSLSPNEDYLFFMNKNDLTLWALKLN